MEIELYQMNEILRIDGGQMISEPKFHMAYTKPHKSTNQMVPTEPNLKNEVRSTNTKM